MKYIFLDRDGVINKQGGKLTKDALNFHKGQEDIELIEQSAQAIKLLNENNFTIIVITNQPGIARGIVTVEQVEQMNNKLIELLQQQGATINKIYYCPHHPIKGVNPQYTKECDCRKPKPGMILQAKKDFNIEDLSKYYMIGDKIGDIKTGDLAGCKTILVKTGYGGNEHWNDATPQHTVKNLYEAVTQIVLKK
jgi:histidinol-phosphate phosphatase family protein